MYQTTDFRKGLKVQIDGKLFAIVECNHVNPGKGSAFVKTRLKNLETGQVLERTFKVGADGAEVPDFEEREMSYMYNDAEGFHFMDQNTYESVAINEDRVGDAKNYLQEGIVVDVLYYNQRPLTIELPNFVELAVTETDPGLKGDTAAGGMKKAIMETGLQVNVPLFIEVGEVLKVDTRSGEYVERVKK